jgi:Tfp pilus assembly protein PilF
MLYDKQKKDTEAKATILDALRSNPKHPDLIVLMASLAHEKEDYVAAEQGYRLAIQTLEDQGRRRNKDYNPASLAQAHFNLGSLLDKLGKFNEAMEEMRKVIQVQPQSPEAFNYIGYSYADRNIKLAEARKFVESALKLDPENAYYLDSMGWVDYRQGRYTSARDHLVRSIKALKTSQKEDAVIFDHLAEVFLKLEERTAALEQWDKALKLDPDNKAIREKREKHGSAGPR